MIYHIVNPAAGQGTAESLCAPHRKEGDTVYLTAGIGDAARYVEEQCRAAAPDDPPQFFVYGGDGTIGEAVNGIMAADAGLFAELTPVPAGTGNDFVRFFDGEPSGTLHTVDVIRVNDRYSVNMLNIGFDCSVVSRAAEWKKRPLISGSAAYLFGVADVLFHKMGQELEITWEDADGASHTVKDSFLLCVAANAAFCGGGFRAAPAASVEDGLIDLMLVKTVSRLRFLRLVKSYHDGTHITPDRKPSPAFADIIRYESCRSVRITGLKELCCDGEVSRPEAVELSVCPRALQCRVL